MNRALALKRGWLQPRLVALTTCGPLLVTTANVSMCRKGFRQVRCRAAGGCGRASRDALAPSIVVVVIVAVLRYRRLRLRHRRRRRTPLVGCGQGGQVPETVSSYSTLSLGCLLTRANCGAAAPCRLRLKLRAVSGAPRSCTCSLGSVSYPSEAQKTQYHKSHTHLHSDRDGV